MDVIDAAEAARRLGRSIKAVYKMVERKQLTNLADDRRVLLSAAEVENKRVKFLGIAQIPLKLQDRPGPRLRLVELKEAE